MLYGTFLSVHSTAMMLALSLLVVSELLLTPAKPRPVKAALLVGRIGGALLGLGMIAGVGLLLAGGWSLATPWLIASFALIGVMMAVEGKYVRPWQKQAKLTLSDLTTADEIMPFVRQRAALIGRLTIIALFAVVALLMVAKPGLDLVR